MNRERYLDFFYFFYYLFMYLKEAYKVIPERTYVKHLAFQSSG
jgi:hypothetical protein